MTGPSIKQDTKRCRRCGQVARLTAQLVDLIRQNGTMTVPELIELTRGTPRTVYQTITDLVEFKKLEPRGKERRGKADRAQTVYGIVEGTE